MFKTVFRISLSIGVSLLILALLLQLVTSGLPDQQRPSVLAALQNTDFRFVLAYVLLALVALLVRAARYRLLISMTGESSVPTFGQMVLVTGIRNMVVDLFPARLGELGYVGLLNRGYGVKLANCVSSLGVSIAFDFLAVLVVILLIVAKQMLGGDVHGWALAAMLMAVLISTVAVAGLFVITPWVNRWLGGNFAASDESSLWGKVLGLLNDFTLSLQAVRRAGKTLQVLLLSIVIRLLKYGGMYLLFLAVAIPSFATLAAIPAEHAIGALIGGEIGASMPIPTFMSFGAYEAGTALVFQLLGVGEQAVAVVTMLCVHIWSQCMDYLLGGIFFALFIFLVRRAPKTDSAVQASVARAGAIVRAVTAALALALGVGFLGYQLWAASKLGSLSAPQPGTSDVHATDAKSRSQAQLTGVDGFVVFSSNRDGNHDIFRLDLPSLELTKLTTHPHTETYPRVSPDGQRLVFARAHQAWVSQRNTVAWDIYLLNLADGVETKLASGATAPAWINNQQISFLQSGRTIVRLTVDSGALQTVFAPGVGNPMPSTAMLQNPSVHPRTDDVSFTGRQNDIGSPHGHWGTAISINNRISPVAEGCELRWRNNGEGLYQVAKGGRDDDLRIVSVDAATQELTTLIDLAGEFSHEYWPIESSDGQYMVFGASRGKQDHEHDVADYEIFLWQQGSDPAKAIRLTFHTGNDNWPSVHIN